MKSKVTALCRSKAEIFLRDDIKTSAQTLCRNERRIEWALLFGYLLIVLIAAVHLSGFSLNHDTGDFLLEVRGMREGRPYADANMPSNIWLPYLSVLISDQLPAFYLADIHQTVLFLFSVGCTTLMFLLLHSLNGRLVRFTAGLGSTAILLILPGYHFGQREYLFALSCAPLLALLYNRCAGAFIPLTLSILVAATAAFGASQKPYFIVFLVALTGVDFAAKKFRGIAWEFLLIGVFIAAYFCWITIVYPDYFFGHLRGALKTLGVMRLPLGLTLALSFLVPLASIKIFLLNVAMFGVGARMSPDAKPIALKVFLYFVAVSALAWLCAFAQRFCFDYHFLPFKLVVACASAILFAWLIATASDCMIRRGLVLWGERLSSASYALTALYVLLLLNLLGENARLQLSRQEALNDPFTKALQALPPRTPILMLSTRVTPITPIHAYADIRWTGGFVNLLSALPIAHALEHPDENYDASLAAAQGFREGVNGSFANPSPQVVFVDVSKAFPVFGVYRHPDILDLMLKSANFQKRWAEYEKVGRLKTIYDQELDVYQKK